jgi:hypothetical protein
MADLRWPTMLTVATPGTRLSRSPTYSQRVVAQRDRVEAAVVREHRDDHHKGRPALGDRDAALLNNGRKRGEGGVDRALHVLGGGVAL